MSLDILISQQQSSIKMIEMFVRLGRANKEELDVANDKLKKLLSEKEVVAETTELKVSKEVPKYVEKKEVVNLSVTPMKQQLLREIKVLRMQQAELSNKLHLVPEGENAAHLTTEIIAFAYKIEGLWTKYRYLERNGVLPDEIEEGTEEKSVELLRLESERKKYCEERSKLKKKLDSAGNKPAQVEKWAARKWIVDGIIQDLDAKIKVLK